MVKATHTLDDEARARKLRILDDLEKRPPTRSAAATERELRDIRRGRREGWRRRIRGSTF